MESGSFLDSREDRLAKYELRYGCKLSECEKIKGKVCLTEEEERLEKKYWEDLSKQLKKKSN